MKPIRRLIYGLLALVGIVAVVVGAPVLLIRVGRLDVFQGLSLDRLLSLGYQADLLLGLLTVIAWIAWLLACLSLVSEALSHISRRRIRISVPGIGVFAPASAVLVTALVGLVAAANTSDAPQHSALEPAPSTGAVQVVDASISQPEVRHASGIPHTVTNGEDLWTLAENHFGDGSRWREIAEANDTTLLDPLALLEPGSMIWLPAPSVTPLNAELPAETIEVSEGDSLWSIAERELGGGDQWPQIADANPERVTDPDHIDVGWKLRLPPAIPTDQSDAPRSDESGADPASQKRDPLAPQSGQTAPAPAPTSSEPKTTVAASSAPTATDSRAPEPSVTEPDATASSSSHPADVPATGVESVPPAVPTTAPTSTSVPQLQEPCSIPDADPMDDVSKEQFSIADAVPAVAGISVALAASIVGAIAVRSRRQLSQRQLGTDIARVGTAAAEMNSALKALASEPAPARAQRATRMGAPASAKVGATAAGEVVRLDFEDYACVALAGDEECCRSVAAAVAVELASDEESDVDVIVCGESFSWLESLDEPRVRVCSDSDGQSLLEAEVRARATNSDTTDIAQLRADPERAEAWRPLVFIFERAIPTLPEQNLAALGIAVLTCTEQAGVDLTIRVDEEEASAGPLGTFTPQWLSAPARRALDELFTATIETPQRVAPWWNSESAGPALSLVTTESEPTQLRTTQENAVGADVKVSSDKVISDPAGTARPISQHPTLYLLGPVELAGTRGTLPNRAIKQCEEYCCWLLENPGATAPQMTRSLLVAESTRRSNMSRLRSWLGSDDEGQPYLPEAYTGRIHLHPGVSSDWEQFRLLLAAGVNRASDEALHDALSMVRGAPLADAAPGQWHWAEELRFEMSAMVRDVGVVLGRRLLGRGEIDAARWAAARALSAAPEDEQLMGLRLQTEHLAGNRAEVERLVLHITRQARLLGVDLMDETVTLLQEVVEGQARMRRA